MKKEQEQERILAAAIKYDGATDAAPKVTASGRGMVAERIITIARENGVPIKSDPALIQVLGKLKVGAEIPEELYQAVAEILAFVYSLNENQRQQNIFE